MSVFVSNFGCTVTIVSSGSLFFLNRLLRNLPSRLTKGYGVKISATSNRDSIKKAKKWKKGRKDGDRQLNDSLLDMNDSTDQNNDSVLSDNDSVLPRSKVLTACIATSAVLVTLGIIIRQVSHVASMTGWQTYSSEVSFGFETWHLQCITGLVILISSSRYMLLKIWQDFADSSETANQQVLTSLQPLDYFVVSILPGFSEEFLFRGALQPLFGNTLFSALLIAAIFGSLHLSGGRKYSFAIWATAVGFMYGYATIVSSSVVVPMAAHAVNNLVGGGLWWYSSNSSEQK